MCIRDSSKQSISQPAHVHPSHLSILLTRGIPRSRRGLAHLYMQLPGKPCQPYNSDQRIAVKKYPLHTYPDISVTVANWCSTQPINRLLQTPTHSLKSSPQP